MPARNPYRTLESRVDVLLITNFILKVLVLSAVAGVPLTAWRLWLRRPKQAALEVSVAPPELNERLERMENMIEAMSVEMERVTEAQRFNARLLSETRTPELPSRT